MDKVYIVRAFDGDYSSIRRIFSTLEKANEYKEKSRIDDIEHYGYEMDSYHIDEYKVD